MSQPAVAPYGSWKSPITSDLIVSKSISLGGASFVGEDIYWTELRPAEGGRQVIVRRAPDGRISDVTPMPFNVRTTVHEYGGRCSVFDGDTLYFSNFADQRLYIQKPGQVPQPLTPEVAGQVAAMRYADPIVDPRHNRLICVREDHTQSDIEAVNTLVGISLNDGADQRVLVSGSDFYSNPRLSPDGKRLAWLSWNHPNLPWDGTELWVAPIRSDGSLGEAELVAGGPEESIFQPEWSPDGVLYFVSDRTGWWNLYRQLDGRVEALLPMEAEFGVPQWVFGTSTYSFESAQRLICTYTRLGRWHLASLDLATLQMTPIETPYTDIRSPHVMPGRVLFTGGSATEPTSIVSLDLRTLRTHVLRRSSDVSLDSGYISVPEVIEFPTENDLTAYAYYYPPANKDFIPPAGERPPLLVISHGGPTSAAPALFNLNIQYWTSRGFAVVDVNYGGSTGYGRAYRERLNGNWGVVDVDDCVNAARTWWARAR